MPDLFAIIDDDMLIEVLKHMNALALVRSSSVCVRFATVERKAQQLLWRRLVAQGCSAACVAGNLFDTLGFTYKKRFRVQQGCAKQYSVEEVNDRLVFHLMLGTDSLYEAHSCTLKLRISTIDDALCFSLVNPVELTFEPTDFRLYAQRIADDALVEVWRSADFECCDDVLHNGCYTETWNMLDRLNERDPIRALRMTVHFGAVRVRDDVPEHMNLYSRIDWSKVSLKSGDIVLDGLVCKHYVGELYDDIYEEPIQLMPLCDRLQQTGLWVLS